MKPSTGKGATVKGFVVGDRVRANHIPGRSNFYSRGSLGVVVAVEPEYADPLVVAWNSGSGSSRVGVTQVDHWADGGAPRVGGDEPGLFEIGEVR
ncbi:hypothetical protein ACWDSF_06110 [Nocardia beijingensis]